MTALRLRCYPARVASFLTGEPWFPDVSRANRDGLLAIGGDLTVERLLLAYRSGIFPWPAHRHLLTWYAPNPRAILELDGLHVSRSLAKRLRRADYECRVDTAFHAVVRACGESSERRPATWITPELQRAYVELHQLGVAHSVETWRGGELVGGLYGVSLGGFFGGESMFSRAPDASKVALVHLVERMRMRGLTLLDVQIGTAHLMSLGAIEIPREHFMRRLASALDLDLRFD